MVAKRYVPYKARISRLKAAQRARSAVQLPLPIRKGFLILHISVLPFVLPGGVYHSSDDREGEVVDESTMHKPQGFCEWLFGFFHHPTLSFC
jgi:hypothetical protein